ncbi:MAG: response regulator [Candidatus Melainabacteria bacterium]|nr:response regulator [Candidatus Melainabacteria bacterium]
MKILIADKDNQAVKLLDLILKELKFEPIVCNSGEEAWRRFQSNNFPPVLIIDPNLPDISGFELLKRVRESQKGKVTYVIFLAPRGLRENLIAAYNAGVDDYIVKPFYAEEMKARLRSAKRLVTLQSNLLDRNILLEEMVYAVTHDMRTPLIAMEMTGKQAQEGIYGDLPESYRKILKTTEGSLKDLLSMVDNLLRVARYEAGKIERNTEPVDLHKICQECLDELRPIYEKKSLNVKLLQDTLEVKLTIVRQDLKRVIFNLLDNAIKFTPARGSITLSVQRVQDKVIVGVQDSGRGVRAEEAKELFNRFARASGARHAPGTGLGLYMCRRIIEAHGGIIDCIPRKSEGEGTGTTFSFMLPVQN